MLNESSEFRSNLRRARRGDQSAFGRIWLPIQNALRRFVFRRLPPAEMDHEVADEIVQDTALRTLERIDQFKGVASGSWRKWVYAIAERFVLQLIRRRCTKLNQRIIHETAPESLKAAVLRLDQIAANQPSPSSQAARNEQQAILRRTLSQIPDEDRRIVQLKTVENKTFKEICDSVGLPETTVARRLHGALKKLHRLLKDHSDG